MSSPIHPARRLHLTAFIDIPAEDRTQEFGGALTPTARPCDQFDREQLRDVSDRAARILAIVPIPVAALVIERWTKIST